MAIDPSIALGVKPVQIESPLNQMAKVYEMQNAVQSNKLNQMKMDEYARNVAEDEQFKNALTQLNRTSPTYAQDEEAVYGLKGIEGLKALAAQRKEQALADVSKFELANKNFNAYRSTLAGLATDPNLTKPMAVSAAQQLVAAGVVPANFATMAEQLPDDPIALRAALKNGARAQLAPKDIFTTFAPELTETDTGKAKVFIDKNPNSPTYGQTIKTFAKTATPGELMTDARERERIRQGDRRDVVAHQQVSEDGTVTSFNKFGDVIGTVKGVGKPSAQYTKTKEQTKRLNTDLNLAITELTNATKDGGLIDQSTGSGLGKAANTVRGFVTGGASSGAIAGAKLAPIADLALKIIPRFEGPQSDKDTQSYKEAAGQLADTSIPNEIRKEAGRTVLRLMKNRKNQFVTQEMAQEGVAPNAGGDVDASNPLLK